jgi:hypothetical protein
MSGCQIKRFSNLFVNRRPPRLFGRDVGVDIRFSGGDSHRRDVGTSVGAFGHLSDAVSKSVQPCHIREPNAEHQLEAGLAVLQVATDRLGDLLESVIEGGSVKM